MTQDQFDLACSRVIGEFVQRKIGEARDTLMAAFGAPVAVQSEPSKEAQADGEPIAKCHAARDRAYEALSERYGEEQS